MSVIALIPARSGSRRLADKNIRPLAGHPVLAYTIAAAIDSGVFDAVLVSTDSERYAAIARHYGAEAPFLRPTELSDDVSPDIEWVLFTLRALAGAGREYDAFSILRPTSPFRLPETIRRAWLAFEGETGVDSLRAVEKCREHPGKMWIVRGARMLPLLPFGPTERPWHSTPYQALPEVYVQNASLEMAWSHVALAHGTIAGQVVMPFLTEGYEGYDINRLQDWEIAETLVREGRAALPAVNRPPYPGKEEKRR